MPFYRDISTFASFMFLISGNLSPYLLSVTPFNAAAQVQQWELFWKSHAAFIMVPAHVEHGQVMLYIKQKKCPCDFILLLPLEEEQWIFKERAHFPPMWKAKPSFKALRH